MLHILPERQADIQGVKVAGGVHQSGLPGISDPPPVQPDSRAWPGADIALLDEDFQDWETEAIRSEPFGHKHKDNFHKIAVVGDSWRLRLEMKLFAPFLAAEVRNLTRSELS